MLSLSTGNAVWLDSNQRTSLILWHTAEQWADIVYSWARSVGLEESVTTIDELTAGDEVQGTGQCRDFVLGLDISVVLVFRLFCT